MNILDTNSINPDWKAMNAVFISRAVQGPISLMSPVDSLRKGVSFFTVRT
ncbi:hypothetical protein [Vulcanisaeta distributa]|nr:hypothetical protein [Vulcanisaeta distributa]